MQGFAGWNNCSFCAHIGVLFTLLLLTFLPCDAKQADGVAKDGETCWDNSEFRHIFPIDYHKSDPPLDDSGQPVRVFLSFHIMDIDDISEEKMAFRLHLFVVDMWKDHRLNLTLFVESDAPNKVLPSEVYRRIWKPDIIFVNSKHGYLFAHSVPNIFVRVLKDGYLYRSTRYLFQVDCLMELQNYPMDTQKCYVKVGFLATPAHIATLHWMDDDQSPHSNFSDGIKLLENIHPLQFDLLDPVADRKFENWMHANHTYLYANFTFVRRLTASVVNTYIPSTFVVILSWCSFWLDINAVPARITLGVTSMLTLATQVVQSRTSQPPVDYLKAVDIWLFVCLIMVFASIVEYAMAYNVEKVKTLSRQTSFGSIPTIPKFGKSAFKNYQTDNRGSGDSGCNGGNSMTMTTPAEEGRATSASLTLSDGLPDAEVLRRRKQTLKRRLTVVASKLFQKTNVLDKWSRFTFPIIFVLFTIIYWMYYLL